MRTLFVTEFVTLDGVMEAPGGEPTHPHTNWVSDYPDPEQQEWKFQETLATQTLLIGRVTYESFAGAWPGYEGPFADKMNAMEKVVVSNTITDPEWDNTTVLSGDIVAGITELKAGDGGLIQVAGSCSLVHLLIDNDLVDELRLMVFPVSIGAGLRVFPDTQKKTPWKLTATQSFASGTRVDTYHPMIEPGLF
jgi:dihydrofolate reductase